jgi:hypothetical protein
VRATFRVIPRIDPDRLAVAVNHTFFDWHREQLNLLDYVKAGLSELSWRLAGDDSAERSRDCVISGETHEVFHQRQRQNQSREIEFD